MVNTTRRIIPAVAAAMIAATPALAADKGAGEAMAKMTDAKGGEIGSVMLSQTPRGVLLSLDLANRPNSSRPAVTSIRRARITDSKARRVSMRVICPISTCRTEARCA